MNKWKVGKAGWTMLATSGMLASFIGGMLVQNSTMESDIEHAMNKVLMKIPSPNHHVIVGYDRHGNWVFKTQVSFEELKQWILTNRPTSNSI